MRDVCVACWDNFVEAIHQTAAEHGVPVASTMDAFNGPDRRTDPSEKGYIKDGLGPSEAGIQRMAEALQQTGYAYSGK